MSTRRKKLAVAGATLVVCGLIGWIVSIAVRSHTLYEASKGGARGWRGSVYRSDPELGLAPIPLARADEILEPLPDVPSRIDARGFRVPVDAADSSLSGWPIVLALGCSYTYGSCERAEDTFAFRVARQLGGTCLNAGLCSGGAAQQLLLARKLIPQYKPDYVLLQYSPWLIERSRTPYAPTFMGKLPVPYFVTADDRVRIDGPLFETKTFDLPTHEYRSTEKSFGDFLGFFRRVGVPLFAHDDVCSAWISIRRTFGNVPAIASDAQVEAQVYPEIAALCAEHGAQLVIVALENGSVPWTAPETIRALGAPIAYGTNRMRARLPEVTRNTYNRTYLHVAGDPQVLIDAHPNALAHSIIADEIIEALQRVK